MNNIIKWLIFLVLQIPVVAAGWTWWNDNSLLAGVAGIGYEIVLIIWAFGGKVWAELEPEAIGYLAGSVRKHIQEFRPGFPKAYKEEVINRHRFFNTKGLRTKAGAIPELQQVFIELDVDASDPQKAGSNVLTLNRSTDQRLIWDYIVQLKKQPLKALAVIGAPGCGKSTLLQYVALTLAANRQRQYRVPALTPLLLFLRDHIKVIVEEKLNLAQIAEQYFNNKSLYPDLEVPLNWFAAELRKGRMMVMLDGLDEVSNIEERRLVSEWLDEQIRIYEKCYFILTARPQGYRDTPLNNAHILKVQPLNPTQVSKFIRNWYRATKIIATGKEDKGVRDDARRDAHDLLQRLRERPTLNDLTVNPLLLTMIAVVHNHRAVLPGQRVELYSEICDVFLEHWRAAKHVPDRLSAAQKREALEPLAAYMMHHGGSDHNRRTLDTISVLKLIEPYLLEVGIEKSDHLAFLKNLNDNSGIFTETEVGEWGFSHKTFQEYLCASHWAKNADAVPKRWDTMITDVWWQETLLLYAAQSTQTDATIMARTCLTKNTIESLIFLVSLEEEALKLDPILRQTIHATIEGNLTSDKAALRHLAAEVLLHRRLQNNFTPLDESSAIDKELITYAEYQLFIDEQSAKYEYHQPPHWHTYDFREMGLEPKSPITGITPTDADNFCKWLRARTGQQYRVPRIAETQTNLGHSIVEWTTTAQLRIETTLQTRLHKYVFSIKDMSAISIVDILKIYSDFNRDLNRDRALDRDLDFVLNRDLDLDLARDLDFYLSRDLDFDLSRDRYLALALALARDLDIDIAHVFNLVREVELYRARELARELYGYLVHVFNLDHESELDREGERTLDHVSKTLLHLEELLTQEVIPITVALKKTRLIASLITLSGVQNNQTYLVALWKYSRLLFQYAYEGATLREPKRTRRFWEKQDVHSESTKQIYLKYYWLYTVLLARQSGELHAWEGLRLVREYKPAEG